MKKRKERDEGNIGPIAGFKITGFKLADPVSGQTVKEYGKQSERRLNTMEDCVFWINRLFVENLHGYMFDVPRPQVRFNN